MNENYEARKEDEQVVAYLATQFRHFGFLIPVDEETDDNDSSRK